MDYAEALGFVSSLERFGIKPGLERIKALCAALGDPQEALRFVHIAGTNGKGSVSTEISEAFIASGKRTGLFISPYVTDFTERIQIDGRPVDKQVFAETIEKLEPAVKELARKGEQPTEFEVITAAAFDIFRGAGCEAVALEVGLGGRLDSTNVIPTPVVSVITSISTDHTAILGDTVEKIAAEKCGIIKPGGVTVCYPLQKESVLDVVKNKCRETGSRLIIPDAESLTDITTAGGCCSFTYKDTRFSLSMAGAFQAYNAITAYEAALAAGVSPVNAKAGTEKAVLPARMEIISKRPLVILDGGHNPGGGMALASSLGEVTNGKKITAVIGMMGDKQTEGYLSYVAPLCEEIVAVPVRGNPRSLPAGELARQAAAYCPNVSEMSDAGAAVETLASRAPECLLVCGSLYLAGEVREKLIEIFG